MMNRTCILFGLLNFFIGLESLACGSLTLTYQSEVNSFFADYPGCTVIEGDLMIGYGDIVDLSGLSTINEIQGNLYISNCSMLGDFSGLDNLTHIGGELIIMSLDVVQDLSGFSSLESVGGIQVILCENFVNFSGAPNLQTVGWNIDVDECGSFVSFEGLEGVQSLGHIGCLAQVLPNGFSGLQNVSGYLAEVELNTVVIEDFSGLQGVSSIGDLNIFMGTLLNGFAGLEQVVEIGNLDMTYITSPDLHGLDGVQNVSGRISIQNSSDGFNLSTLSGLDQLVSAGKIHLGGIDMVDMTGLGSLQTVDTMIVSYCPYLESMNGLLSLEQASLFKVDSNGSLLGLSGLNQLVNLNSLEISYCSMLQDLSGLNVQLVISESLLINNTSLTYCSVAPVCMAMQNGALAYISGNMPGCSSSEEVLEQCGYSYSTGLIFADLNCDGLFNGEDVVYPYGVVLNEEGEMQCIGNYSGQYFNPIPPNSIETITVVAPTGFESSQVNVVSGDSYEQYSGLDISLCPTVPFVDISVTQQLLMPPSPGFSSPLNINVTNLGNSPAEVVLTLDLSGVPGSTVIDADGGILSGEVVTWNLGLFPVFGSTSRQVHIVMSQDVELGTICTYVASVELLDGILDDNEENNLSALVTEVIGSYDPNDISVDQETVFLPESGLDPDYLEYLIRFQNTGTNVAYNVRVDLSLHELLIPETFELLSTSHNCDIVYDVEEGLAFVFNNIMLPDSATDLVESNGFIRFRIMYTEIASICSIEGQAAIYFDFNDPVYTNVATTWFGSIGVAEAIADETPFLYPNPASDKVMLVGIPSRSVVEIYDVNGRLISEFIAPESGNTLDIGNLPEGYYMLRTNGKALRLGVIR